ncbi:MerR family transcriptional regulator [Enterococcus gallinarum]|uniref:MerR family transcriptional regulator n=1 Tax=Enterococcus gallinarum TaxID=1353 RepID=UPI001AD63CBC|nr:MerR family transcriptional regulator [Enterococcus gallinarum]MBO6418985.1 MerR family transcriptional regulator [Enterococcus gallinarum]MBO6420469.1 MerR family transcriptional regulator [Enterococcus gallinarum]
MKKFLTISELAAYGGVSRRTLLYYDQIGLFKPKQIGENGYRYYGFEQCAELDVILVLRALDMSLEEIQTFLRNRNPETMQKELIVRRKEVDQKITELEEHKAVLDRFISRFEKVQTADFTNMTYSYRSEEYFAVSEEINEYDETSFFQAFSRFYPYLDYKDLFSGYPIGYLVEGSAFDQESIHEAPYRALVMIPKERLPLYSDQAIICRPAGNYVSGFVRGEIHHLKDFTKRFKAYLESANLQINGDIWELMWQDDVSTDQKEQQIFEVMLPVKERIPS